MSRRLDEEIHVKTVPVEDPSGLATECPERFVWGQRLYVVQVVLAVWRERRSWWREPGVGAEERDPDRFVWRVQACAGASATPGVYDLTRERRVSAGPRNVGGGRESEQVGDWRLVRVLD